MLFAAALLMQGPEFALIALTLAGGTFLGWKLLSPLVHALARRLEPRSADPATALELAELRARVEELEAQQGRVPELEDRLDFAERLLARQRDAARLTTGGEGQ